MAFAEEIQRFGKTHPFAEEKIDGISTRYLLCGKVDEYVRETREFLET